MRNALRPDRRDIDHSSLTLSRGILTGGAAGLAGTIVMDLFGGAVLLVAGGPDTISFALIGDAAASFFSRIGIDIPGGTPLGLMLHYLIGLLLGITFGGGLSIVGIGTIDRKRLVALGILYVEAMSVPMLAVAALVLQMPPSYAALYFATSFTLHLVFGSALGVAMSLGNRLRPLAGAVVGT